MAFFSPFSALTAAAGSFAKNYPDDQAKSYDQMGIQALGNAFKQMQMQGPIDQMNARGGLASPQGGQQYAQGGQSYQQPPNPGQSSQPMQPPQGPPMGPAAAAPPPMAGGAMPPGGTAQPPGGPPPGGGGIMPGGGQIIGGGPGGPPMGGGGPQGGGSFDLQTLAAKITQANPNLPPQALVAALTRAVPLLNVQGRQELAQLRLQMQQQTLDLRRDSLDVRERLGDRGLDIRESQGDRRLEQGDRRLDQGDTREGRIREQGDRRLGQGDQRLDLQRGGLDERRREFDTREQRIARKDEEQRASGLSREAKNDLADRYIKTGQLPTLGWGSQARADKSDILNIATQKRQAAGLPVDKMIKDQQKLKAEQIAIQRFESGPQGNTTRSLGVVVDHLATLRSLGEALSNNDVPLFNRVAQAWAEQTGSSAPTNFDTAKRIVGAEIIKALGVAGAGTAEERKEAADAFSRARSPEQLDGAIHTAQKLLVGQVNGLRRQFIQSTGLPGEAFDNMLGPEAKKFLAVGGEKKTEYLLPESKADPMEAAKDKLREGMGAKGQTKSGWSFEAVQ